MNYCDECESVLLPGAVKCKCGWIDPKPNKRIVQAADEIHEERSNILLSDYMSDSMKDVQAFKKEHGEDWQHELMSKISRDCKTATTDDYKKRQQHYKELKIKFDTPEKQKRRTVFESMPAPHDVEGMDKYKELLADVQNELTIVR